MKNDINHINGLHNMIVLNKENPQSKCGYILTDVSMALRNILTKCPVTINSALAKLSAKRNTVCINYGFTLNKCDMLNPKNAVLDYNVPIHSSGVTEVDELQTVFVHANQLLLKYERNTKRNGSIFGVKEGNWFHHEMDHFHSSHRNKIVQELGIKSHQIDWRIFGLTLVFYSKELHLHRDVLNSIKDNYSMVVCFNHVVDMSTIPISQQIPSLKKLQKETGSSYFNMSLLCYGRHCIDAVSDKMNERILTKEKDPLVCDFFDRVLEDNSWEYESWLLNDAYDMLHKNIMVLSDGHVQLQINSFKQNLKQNKDAQNLEDHFHKGTYWARKNVLQKFLYGKVM